MRTPLALLAFVLAASARAGTPAVADPGAAPAEERSSYWHTSRNSWWGDAVSRRDLNLVADVGTLDDLCFIPPAADWVTEGAPADIEKKYAGLVWRASYSVAQAQGRTNLGGRVIGSCGVNAPASMAYIGELSNFYNGVFDDSVKARTGFRGCLMSKDFVKTSPKYASHGKTISNAGLAVMETLNLLLKSKNPDTVVGALTDIQTLKNPDKFRDGVEALVRDKSVTAKVTIRPDDRNETIPLRVYAMRALAGMERTERTAKLLALIWHDEKEPPEVREGAIRAFAFVAQWPGPDAMNSMAARPAMLKALHPLLSPLMMLTAGEYDKKEDAGPKAVLSGLGEAGECAVNMFPKDQREKARKGLPWSQ